MIRTTLKFTYLLFMLIVAIHVLSVVQSAGCGAC